MVHLAGPLIDGVQLCTRCGIMLTDYRGAMVPEGSGPLYGWAEGAHVERQASAPGEPTFSGVTEERPDCERVQ